MEENELDKWLTIVNKNISGKNNEQEKLNKKIQSIAKEKEAFIIEKLKVDAPKYKETIRLNKFCIDVFSGENSFRNINSILYDQIISKAFQGLKSKKTLTNAYVKLDKRNNDDNIVNLKVYVGPRGISRDSYGWYGHLEDKAKYLERNELNTLFYILKNFKSDITSELRSDKRDIVNIVSKYTDDWYMFDIDNGKTNEFKFPNVGLICRKDAPYGMRNNDMGVLGIETHKINGVRIRLGEYGIVIEPFSNSGWSKIDAIDMFKPLSPYDIFNVCNLPDDCFNFLKDTTKKSNEGCKKNIELLKQLKEEISPYIIARLI